MRKQTENGRISFTERNGMRSNWVNQMREKKVRAKNLSTPVQDDSSSNRQRVGRERVVVSAISSSPSLFLQTRRATGNIRQPRCGRFSVRSGSAVIAEIAAVGDVPVSGTSGTSVSTGTRRSTGST
jgi:hypothetical protein